MAPIAITTLLMGALLASCGGPGPAPPRDKGIRIGSFDFPESVLLAQLYGQALRARGYPVQFVGAVGTREIVDPALGRGLLDLIPEYAGSALDFLQLNPQAASPDVQATHAALSAALGRLGALALSPAPAQDGNVVVVTASTAAQYGLRSIGDLAPVAPRMVFGGPRECPERPRCLLGLERIYGLHFGQFAGLDAGGPITLQALLSDEVGAALLFSTNPNLDRGGLVVLSDDRALQPAENVTPVLRRAALATYGPGLVAAVNLVSDHLTTEVLRDLNGRLAPDGSGAPRVAAAWLAEQGLV